MAIPVPRRGRPTGEALEVLRGVLRDLRNVQSGGHDWQAVVDVYGRWVNDAERMLRGVFEAGDLVWPGLLTQRLFAASAFLTQANSRQIRSEIEYQIARLAEFVERLDQLGAHFRVEAGTSIVVPDTNVLVRGKLVQQINWPELVGTPRVRLLVAHITLDELDDLSYRSSDTSKPAKQAIRALLETREGEVEPWTVTNVRKGVSLQFLSDEPGHKRHPNADKELMQRASLVQSLTHSPLVVATNDRGMELRSVLRGLRTVAVPIRSPDPAELSD